jgi:hypothetical protein
MPLAPLLPADPSVGFDLLQTVLDVSLTGIGVLRPLYDTTSEIVDFTIEYLNPPAQRMMGLPEQSGGRLLTHFPYTIAAGIFDYYRRAYNYGAPDRHKVNYQADGLDNYFHIVAQRSGELLVVSFTDTSDHDRSQVEQALRESQAAEQAARAEAEAQRQRLHDILMQMPAQVALNRGPDHVYDLVNPRYQQQFPARAV